MTQTSTHRHVLWATSIVGGATFAALLISLLRNKAIALLGGPEAVGLIGVFTSLVSLAGAIAALGLDTSAVRLISQADKADAKRVRFAVWALVCPLALSGAAAVWLAKELIATVIFGDPNYSNSIGWLGVGVAATVLGSVQVAIIQADGRVTDVARIKLWSALVGTLVSVAAVDLLGLGGLVIAAVALPGATLVVAQLFSGTSEGRPTAGPKSELVEYWKLLASVGFVIMLTYATSSAVNLAERSIVMRELGASAAGKFHASAAILWVNLSVVLNAMAADYYPRLSRAANDTPEALPDLVNQQLEVIWLLAAPVLIFVSVFAPLLLRVLYSSEFQEAASLLRLLVIAGALRLPIFALGYFILAKSGSRAFWFGELAGALMLPVVWLLASTYGLPGVGVGVIIVALSTCAVYAMYSHRSGVALTSQNVRRISLLLPLLIALTVLFTRFPSVGILLGCTALAIQASYSFMKLQTLWRREAR